MRKDLATRGAAALAIAAGLALGAGAPTAALADDWGGTVEMQRLYNPNSGCPHAQPEHEGDDSQDQPDETPLSSSSHPRSNP